jgi:hypothetical protein
MMGGSGQCAYEVFLAHVIQGRSQSGVLVLVVECRQGRRRPEMRFCSENSIELEVRVK